MDLESKLSLERDEPAVLAFLEENEGTCKREEGTDGVYWLTLRPKRARAELFYVRVAWSVYPHHAPSVLFRDGAGSPTGSARAWPDIPGYQPGNNRICKPFTAEGMAAHREWRWTSDGNPFLWVVTVLQDDLDTKFTRRAG